MNKINLRVFGIIGAVSIAISLTSCLKDNGPGAEDYSHSPALVGFQYAGFAFVPVVAPIFGTPQDSATIELTLSVASLTLTTPVTVTIAADQPTLDAYNATDTPLVYLPLPPSDYTLPNGGVITINPGQQIVTFTVHLLGDSINFNQPYALALKIISAQGATIATNLNTYILIPKLRSIYEGNYNDSGTIYRFLGTTESSGLDPTGPSFAITGPSYFTTVTANEVDGTLNIPGFSPVEITLTVNQDNTVTIGQSPNSSDAVSNTAGITSTYNPSTQTFTIYGGYLNAAPALRAFEATLTLQ
jgi:hypothetical protein